MADLFTIAGRVAAVLDVLSEEPMSVRVLAHEAGVPRSTAQRLLEALEANGRAERTPRGWISPSVDVLFAPIPKDSGERPAPRDDPANRGVRWAA